MKDHIIVPVSIESLNLISEFLQEKSSMEHLPSRKMWDILLAADEICSQIIDIINIDSSETKMELTWKKERNMITIMIKTDGFAFNPMEIEKNYNKDEGNQSLNGMKLYLVKQMVDEIYYFRKNNKNIVEIKKILKTRRNKKKH